MRLLRTRNLLPKAKIYTPIYRPTPLSVQILRKRYLLVTETH